MEGNHLLFQLDRRRKVASDLDIDDSSYGCIVLDLRLLVLEEQSQLLAHSANQLCEVMTPPEGLNQHVGGQVFLAVGELE